ncbi:MAG: large conductance mechanosensitive channel protein MscL [Bacilli bacterium]|nr:large conductance mechanosensitive channel protein MscL [Bacilli bacterium]
MEKENLKEKAKKHKKVLDEFKEFISKGNVLDLAIGVIIGGAFQGLVKSLTDNLISPILGCFSEVDFSSFVLRIGKLNLRYGAFLTDVINFIIMAFVVFLIIKAVNKILVKKPAPQEEIVEIESDEVKILKEIRDELKKNKKN